VLPEKAKSPVDPLGGVFHQAPLGVQGPVHHGQHQGAEAGDAQRRPPPGADHRADPSGPKVASPVMWARAAVSSCSWAEKAARSASLIAGPRELPSGGGQGTTRHPAADRARTVAADAERVTTDEQAGQQNEYHDRDPATHSWTSKSGTPSTTSPQLSQAALIVVTGSVLQRGRHRASSPLARHGDALV